MPSWFVGEQKKNSAKYKACASSGAGTTDLAYTHRLTQCEGEGFGLMVLAWGVCAESGVG